MIFNILLAIFFVLFIYLVTRNLLWGLILISSFLPSYLIRFELFGLPTTVLEWMILITFFVWVYKHKADWGGVVKDVVHQRALPSPLNRWFWAIILFFGFSLISVYTAPNHWAALGVWRAYFLEPIIFFAIFISTVTKREDLYKIIWGLVLGAVPIAVFGVMQQFTGWFIPNLYWQAVATRRVTSIFGHPLALALFLAPLLPFVIYLFDHDFRKTKGLVRHDLFYSLIFFIFFLAIFFTQSMGAMLAIVGAVLFFGLLFRRTRKISFLVIIVVGLFLWLSPLKEPFKEEVMFQGFSGQLRVSMWGETIEMLSDHPLWGAGLSAYQEVVKPYHILAWAEIYPYPHNIVLNFWSEIGFFGLVAFLWLLLLFWRAGFELLKQRTGEDLWLVETILASMLIMLIQGLVDAPYFKNDLAVFFWLLMGMMVVNIKMNQKYVRT